MQCACAILSSVACLALQYFYTLSLSNDTILLKKVIEHKMCVSILSTTLSEPFFILRRIERDMIKNVQWSSCKLPGI